MSNPIAHAGVDQTITLPVNSVTLSGSATSGTSPYKYKWTKISGHSAGIITSPTSASTTVTGLIQGVYTFQLTVTDRFRNTGKDSMIVTVSPISPSAPVITSGGSSSGQIGQAFSYQITATNSPTSFSANWLPTGLSINTSTGLISGTPTVAGNSSTTINAINAGGTGSANLSFNIAIASPVITSANSANSVVGVFATYQITATNNPTSYNATSLPTGFSVNTSTGVISGTPTTAGVYTPTVSATNAGGTGNLPVTVTITNPPAPIISSVNTATGITGQSFTYQIIASQNPTSYSATGLPTGLSINTSTGAITGTPTVLGTSTVTLGATNIGGTGNKTLTITVNPPTPVVSSSGTASATVGTAFSYTITASNTPTGFSFTGAPLPPGLTVDISTGIISGTPTTIGTYVTTIGASNVTGTGTKTLTVTVSASVVPAPVITSGSNIAGVVGTPISTYTITATNTPTSYSATGLPAALSVNTSNGQITGTPSAAGTYTITIGATNAGGTGTAILTLTVTAAIPTFPTANDSSSHVPYSSNYAYGNNIGYYNGSGGTLSNQNLGLMAASSGARTLRPFLPDYFINTSPNFAVADFNYYASVGHIDLTAFLAGAATANRDPFTYPGCDHQSYLWTGIYNSPWLDSNRTQINTANPFAVYIKTVVNTYSTHVKFWEIINEADFTYTGAAFALKSDPNSWWNVTPAANDLQNLKAPIFHYIRLIRIAWEVIKAITPNAYVATGGFGYPSFADAFCRFTDNPGAGDPTGAGSGVAGSVTTNFPLYGGAYFDVLNFHDYPQYSLCPYDQTATPPRNVCKRYSDWLAFTHIDYLNQFTSVMTSHGYDGSTFPKKGYICTETDVARQPVGTDWGSLNGQINYIIKMHVLSQKAGMYQVYKYGLGDGGDANGIFNAMGVYGNLTVPGITPANAPKEPVFYACLTLYQLLYTKKYDGAKTAALSLPASVDGVAFNDGANNYIYVLWAKTSVDNSEIASANYVFPFTFPTTRREWDYSQTSSSTVNSSASVALTGFPSFFL